MNRKSCPPGQARIGGRCIPARLGVFFTTIPARTTGGTPGGGLSPFTNSADKPAPPAPAPSPAPAPPAPFRFTFSGHIDSSAFQTIPLALPFDRVALPLTIEIKYVLNPPDYRTNDGGFGGFGFSLSVPSKNFGFELQGSNPSNFFVSTYSNYRPDVVPGNLLADRRDYQIAVWPPGNPVVRLTLDANLVPRLYFDGVESPISPPSPPSDQPLAEGDYSNVYGYNGAPGRSIDVNPLTIVGRLVPPPAPL